MTQWLAQLVFTGAAIGSMYGLVALGYHLTFLSSRSVNFSQGQSVMLGAVVFYSLAVTAGWPVAPAIGVALATLGLLGVLVERIAVRPFLRRTSSAWLLSTIALGIIVENAALLVMGKETRALASPMTATTWDVLGARVYPLEFFLPIIAVASMLAIEAALHRTTMGKAMRAVAFDHDAARIVGIDPERVNTIAYASGALLAGVCGILLAPLLNVSAGMGTTLGLKAFVVAIVGGIEHVRGIMVVGFACGILETLVAGTLGTGLREIAIFLLVIVALWVRPRGLVSTSSATRV